MLMLFDEGVKAYQFQEEDVEEGEFLFHHFNLIQEPANKSPMDEQHSGHVQSTGLLVKVKDPIPAPALGLQLWPRCSTCLPQKQSKSSPNLERHRKVIRTSRIEAKKFGFQWTPYPLPEGSTRFQHCTAKAFPDFTHKVEQYFTEVHVEVHNETSTKKAKAPSTATKQYTVCNQGVLTKYGSILNASQRELLAMPGARNRRDQQRYFRYQDIYINALENLMKIVAIDSLIKCRMCKVAFFKVVQHPNKKQSATLYCTLSPEVPGYKFLRISCDDNPSTKDGTFETVRMSLAPNLDFDVQLPPVPIELLEYLDNSEKTETGKMIKKMINNYNSNPSLNSGNVGTLAVMLHD